MSVVDRERQSTANMKVQRLRLANMAVAQTNLAEGQILRLTSEAGELATALPTAPRQEGPPGHRCRGGGLRSRRPLPVCMKLTGTLSPASINVWHRERSRRMGHQPSGSVVRRAKVGLRRCTNVCHPAKQWNATLPRCGAKLAVALVAQQAARGRLHLAPDREDLRSPAPTPAGGLAQLPGTRRHVSSMGPPVGAVVIAAGSGTTMKVAWSTPKAPQMLRWLRRGLDLRSWRCPRRRSATTTRRATMGALGGRARELLCGSGQTMLRRPTWVVFTEVCVKLPAAAPDTMLIRSPHWMTCSAK
mmetsp:Transcript_118632/g.221712  ORF Transcript_118632/g.221712 Transcript_118632/m.221712 type:complete len:302 (-) Transcript_118632:989-1894(-)